MGSGEAVIPDALLFYRRGQHGGEGADEGCRQETPAPPASRPQARCRAVRSPHRITAVSPVRA
ncbi:hypothetical protein C1I97_27240 [Streptomyces sp. NTH33]|nr:hypothetical protein C1I97_27240 [Streptomyces sp. NTH33]